MNGTCDKCGCNIWIAPYQVIGAYGKKQLLCGDCWWNAYYELERKQKEETK